MSESLEIDPSSLEEFEEGATSIICRARLAQSGTVVAIKKASGIRKWSREPHDIVKEIRIIAESHHCNIISFLGSRFNTSSSAWELWMPFIPLALHDLLDSPLFTPRECSEISHLVIQSRTRANEPQEQIFTVLAKSIIHQIVLAVNYLHTLHQPIAHRDVKPHNILLTLTGRVQLIDFGIAWQDVPIAVSSKDLWPEENSKMYCDVATGPFRAPELLFGPSSYDAFATDLWSLGASIANFFTAIQLFEILEDDNDTDEEEQQPLKNGFVIPNNLSELSLRSARWTRKSLFNSERGEIGLVWSIFSIRGTPNSELWPGFEDLPHAKKVEFRVVPSIDLREALPNMPDDVLAVGSDHYPPQQVHPTPLDLAQRLLVYPPEQRLKAIDALRHPWFKHGAPPLLPIDHTDVKNANDELLRRATTWRSRDLGFWLSCMTTATKR
ncbi:kinase-like protein [Rickenella mellea]|uniref:cyclin-dependent kinase n=1 Tax=Rickenella mellea TaxID=50990 RepID=A0A4Y7QFI9_9AGAM|nr:kinase-like protein [Rickenella mellea]